ncbi:hypothetical protein ZWY2020_003677 [Hordeum vulgare]|nr:hypothetical protein ZWY2020_003677 [Hordeum vulgare]
MPQIHVSFELLIFLNFATKTFLGEVQIRFWFLEKSISPLAKSFITLHLDLYFFCTQSTEAPPTYVAVSSIACSYFVFPLAGHQICGSRFSLFLLLIPPWVVPNIWHFPYFMGATSTNSPTIKLQPKIYDYIMLIVHILFIPSVCSQVRVIVICLREPGGLSMETFTSNHRFLMVFLLFTASLSTHPDIWCQTAASLLIYSIIEFAMFVALIVLVREEG